MKLCSLCPNTERQRGLGVGRIRDVGETNKHKTISLKTSYSVYNTYYTTDLSRGHAEDISLTHIIDKGSGNPHTKCDVCTIKCMTRGRFVPC